MRTIFTSFLFTLLSLFIVVGGLTACDPESKAKLDNTLQFDRTLDMSRNEYRGHFAPRPIPTAAEQMALAPIPDLAPVSAESDTNTIPMPLVSISVNQTVPLRDVFFELAEQADIDIELDPNIRGAVIFTARERPFDEVVERISRLAGLKTSFEDNILRVENDEPYHKVYRLDYIAMVRNYKSTVDSSVSVISGDGADTGSTTKIESEILGDFWGELEAGLAQILDTSRYQRALSANTQTVAYTEPTAQVSNAQLTGNANATPEQLAVTPPSPTVSGNEGQTPQSTTNVVAEELGAGGGEDNPFFAINKRSNLLTVFASDRQHEIVKNYLDEVKKSLTSQVLIEAKILEVELSDEFASGINWDAALGSDGNVAGFFPVPDFIPDNATGLGTIGFLGSDINFAAGLVNRFGNARTLSSPRMTVMNNQTAILSVAQNEVFFEIEIDTQVTDAGTTSQLDSEIRNVPVGLIIAVHPLINVDTGEVTMTVRPTITRVVGTVSDPAAVSLEGDAVNEVPILAVREMDSIVKMDSGQVMVMGGLMQDRSTGSEEGIPLLSDIPYFGSLFKNHLDGNKQSEIVILIKSTILDQPKPDQTDKDFYRAFANDRRPFPM